jgi:hypothetical protein
VTQVTIKKKIPKNSKNPKKKFSFHEFFQNLLKNKKFPKISKNFQKFPKISKKRLLAISMSRGTWKFLPVYLCSEYSLFDMM